MLYIGFCFLYNNIFVLTINSYDQCDKIYLYNVDSTSHLQVLLQYLHLENGTTVKDNLHCHTLSSVQSHLTDKTVQIFTTVINSIATTIPDTGIIASMINNTGIITFFITTQNFGGSCEILSMCIPSGV